MSGQSRLLRPGGRYFFFLHFFAADAAPFLAFLQEEEIRQGTQEVQAEGEQAAGLARRG
jgi:hypothetical protein